MYTGTATHLKPAANTSHNRLQRTRAMQAGAANNKDCFNTKLTGKFGIYQQKPRNTSDHHYPWFTGRPEPVRVMPAALAPQLGAEKTQRL